MSARDALPTGLALGAGHLPNVDLPRLLGAVVTLGVLLYLGRNR
ncbi:hypothetical protein [Halorarius litoreus]|nr:hypothetical protein [Halorarius litoreus]